MFNLSCIFGLNLYHVRPGFGRAVIRTSWGCVSILLDFHLTSLLRYAGSGIFSFLILFSGSGIFLFSIFLDFHLTTLFRYAGSGIFPSDFPGQLCRAAVAILAIFYELCTVCVYKLRLSFSVFAINFGVFRNWTKMGDCCGWRVSMSIGDASWNILSGQYCWGDLVEIYPWWSLLLKRSG